MAKKEAYLLNKLEIRPEWSAKSGPNYSKFHGKIIFDDENGKKAFEVSIDDTIAKKIVSCLIAELSTSRSGSIINAIKEKFEI